VAVNVPALRRMELHAGRGLSRGVRSPGSGRRSCVLTAGCLTLGLLLAGCGGPQVQLAKTDARYNFERGRSEFAHQHWLEAQTFLKRFLDTNPGNAAADSAQFLIARALYEQKSYAEASVEFGVLPREYPRSPLREEAGYCECMSTFKQMRSSQLDPTFANRAATCFQEFLLRYPDTTWRQASNDRLRDIDDRLAEKQYRLGSMFAKMKRPAAARVYLDEIVLKYPQSRWVPPALVWIGSCQQQQGDFAAARASFERVVRDYPDTQPAREATSRLARMGGAAAAVSAPADSTTLRPPP
jgi:outer membrane protein assembly factor BamD